MLLFSCSNSKKDQNTGNKGKKLQVPVKALIIQPSKLNYSVHATGTLLAYEEVELRSEISGRVTNILFEEGQAVKKGTLLIKMQDADLKAQLKKVQLQIELAASDESRNKILLEQKGISQQDYDVALNKLNSLKADADYIQAQINKTSITAPFSGSVGLRYISEGSFVSASTLLASVQQTDPLKIEFSVPERYASHIKNGLKVNFTTNEEKTYLATVYASDQKIDLNTRSLKVRARCSNPKNELVPGSFVKIDVNMNQINDALIVPAEAVIPVLAGQTVYTLNNGKAKVAKVITGIRTDSEVQILSGLNIGDTIITTGIMMLRDGASVKLQGVSKN